MRTAAVNTVLWVGLALCAAGGRADVVTLSDGSRLLGTVERLDVMLS